MSILIKGMEMPTNCMECKLVDSEYCTCVLMEFYNDDYYVGYYSGKRAPWCPLVEVPPHGRLIDADALLSQYGGVILTAKIDYTEGFRDVVRDVINAPTIIEAEVDDG